MALWAQTGNLIFRGPNPKNFRDLDLRSDDDPTVNIAASLKNYTEKNRRDVLSLAPAWTKWPDYERVSSFFLLVYVMWQGSRERREWVSCCLLGQVSSRRSFLG